MKLTRTDVLFSASALTGETPSLSSLIETKAFDALHELRFHLWIDSALSQAYHSPFSFSRSLACPSQSLGISENTESQVLRMQAQKCFHGWGGLKDSNRKAREPPTSLQTIDRHHLQEPSRGISKKPLMLCPSPGSPEPQNYPQKVKFDFQ